MFDENVLRIPVNHLFLILKFRICDDFVFLTKHPEAFGPWPLLAFMMKTFSKRPRRGQKVAVQISPSCSLNLPFYLFASFWCVIEMPRSCFTQSKAHNHFLICVCPARSMCEDSRRKSRSN